MASLNNSNHTRSISSHRWGTNSVLAIALVCPVVATIVMAMNSSISPDKNVNEEWQVHRKQCLATPISTYIRDRSRLFYGQVRDESGNPVVNATVSIGSLENTLLERGDLQGLLDNGVSIEKVMVTDANGKYEEPALSIGSKMVFVTADGFAEHCAPHKLVQDGYGTRCHIRLERLKKRTVRVKWENGAGRPVAVYLLPFGWHPGFPRIDVDATKEFVEFEIDQSCESGLVIALNQSETDTAFLRVVGVFDCINGNSDVVAGNDVTLADALTQLGQPGDRANQAWCRFLRTYNCEANWGDRDAFLFSIPISPIGMIANMVRRNEPRITEVEPDEIPDDAKGEIHGFVPTPWSPVLIEGKLNSYIAFSSAASEYRVRGIPPGEYRIKCMAWNGDCSFSNGVNVYPKQVSKSSFSRLSIVDEDEARSRQVNGFVLDANGDPVADVSVIMQEAGDFRKYLKSVKTDEHGFFRLVSVPGDSMFFIFAISQEHEAPMRNFRYLGVSADEREVALNLSIYDSSIRGTAPFPAQSGLQLRVIEDIGTPADVVWWRRLHKDNESFLIENVPIGTYAFFLESGSLDDTVLQRVSEVLRVDFGSKENSVDWLDSN